jgi:dihydroorotate dehydrogenase
MLREAHQLSQGRLVLIGCGGIRTGTEILTKMRAGASLVQLYTAFAYDGPGLIPRLKQELAAALRQAGLASAQAAIGNEA